MNEQGFYKLFKTKILDHIPNLMYDRLESKVSSNGLPDLTYAYSRRHGFIEFKYHSLLTMPSNPFKLLHPISAVQYEWLTARGVIGGSCWVVIGTPTHIYFVYWKSLHKLRCPNVNWHIVIVESALVLPMGKINPSEVAYTLANVV